MAKSYDEPGDTKLYAESFIKILLLDVIAAKERWDNNQSQQDSRDLIRTVFAAVEGLIWTYRQHTVAIARDLAVITNEEEAALCEVTYQVTEQGKISKQPRHIPLPAIIRLTTHVAEKISVNLGIRFDTGGWDRFRKAIAIRNRITHPKSHDDLAITNQDVSTCLAAFFWLLEISTNAMEAATAALRVHVQEMREVFQDLKDGDPVTLALYNAVIRMPEA